MRLRRSVRLSVGMALSDCRGCSPRDTFLCKVFNADTLGLDLLVRRLRKSLDSRVWRFDCPQSIDFQVVLVNRSFPCE